MVAGGFEIRSSIFQDRRASADDTDCGYRHRDKAGPFNIFPNSIYRRHDGQGASHNSDY